MVEFRRLDQVAQGNRFAVRIRHFDADRGFAGDALDKNRLGPKSETQVFAKSGDAAVLDPGLGFELKRRDNWTRINLCDMSADVEFRAFLLDRPSVFFQFAFIHLLAALGGLQQGRGRQPEGGLSARNFRIAGILLGRRHFGLVELDYGGNSLSGVVRFGLQLRFVFFLDFLR